jgi:hypothetical protein
MRFRAGASQLRKHGLSPRFRRDSIRQRGSALRFGVVRGNRPLNMTLEFAAFGTWNRS